MTNGNLEGKVVAINFWPTCFNCCHNLSCKTNPRHAAYPHSWHWAVTATGFPDDTKLVIKSGEGTAVYGEPHTGCYEYQAVEGEFLTLTSQKEKYLRLEMERERLDTQCQIFEERGQWNDRVAAIYDRLDEIYDQLFELQAMVDNV